MALHQKFALQAPCSDDSTPFMTVLRCERLVDLVQCIITLQLLPLLVQHTWERPALLLC